MASKKVIGFLRKDALEVTDGDSAYLSRAGSGSESSLTETQIKMIEELHHAVGDASIPEKEVREVVEKYKEYVNIPNQSGWMAIHVAIQAGSLAGVVALIANGADVLAITQKVKPTDAEHTTTSLAIQFKRTQDILTKLNQKICFTQNFVGRLRNIMQTLFQLDVLRATPEDYGLLYAQVSTLENKLNIFEEISTDTFGKEVDTQISGCVAVLCAQYVSLCTQLDRQDLVLSRLMHVLIMIATIKTRVGNKKLFPATSKLVFEFAQRKVDQLPAQERLYPYFDSFLDLLKVYDC